MTQQSEKPEHEAAIDRRQLAKLAIELGPLVVFFIVNSQAARFIDDPKKSIFWGTGFFMVATVAALVASRALFGRIPTMPLVSGFFVVVFGGLTLFLQDDLFIKLKPTLVNTLFALVLFGGLAKGHSLLRYLFGEVFRLDDAGWRILTFRWACFFLALAALNEIVWRNVSTDAWVNFKVFGIMPLTMVFAVMQVGLIRRHEPRADE